MKAADTFTHIDNPEDVVYLRTRVFPVNIRLWRNNADYAALIDNCIELVRKAALAEYEDYKKPHGMSGANLAIPFNIIGIVEGRLTDNPSVKIMVNPTIARKEGMPVKAESNCGSIRLAKPITVERHNCITVSYYNEEKYAKVVILYRETGSFTVQHEIDHNNGILITDREIK